MTLEQSPSGPERVVLSTHGQHLVVGEFLPPDERIILARELAAALSHARTVGAD